MSSIRSKTFDQPDEVRHFPFMETQLAQIGSIAVGRATIQPGWRWSTSIGPLTGDALCQVHHITLVLAGRCSVAPAAGRARSPDPDFIGSIRRTRGQHDWRRVHCHIPERDSCATLRGRDPGRCQVTGCAGARRRSHGRGRARTERCPWGHGSRRGPDHGSRRPFRGADLRFDPHPRRRQRPEVRGARRTPGERVRPAGHGICARLEALQRFREGPRVLGNARTVVRAGIAWAAAVVALDGPHREHGHAL